MSEVLVDDDEFIGFPSIINISHLKSQTSEANARASHLLVGLSPIPPCHRPSSPITDHSPKTHPS